jgi:hypothetical protein
MIDNVLNIFVGYFYVDLLLDNVLLVTFYLSKIYALKHHNTYILR